MIKNYFFLFIFLLGTLTILAQEIRVFNWKDFDLKENVKSCLVTTNYGKEEYFFNRNGLLVKSITRYNDTDYDIIYYKFNGDELEEKRSESYRNDTFDPSTSIAHFYTTDSLPHKKITEKIISYDKEFLDQYVYEYDEKGDLVRITRNNNEGTDETYVEYKKYKGESTVTYLLNNVPIKSVRTSTQKAKDQSIQKVILAKEYIKGQGSKAFEEIFDHKGKLLACQEFDYNPIEKSFVPSVHTKYIYDKNNLLVEEIVKSQEGLQKKKYVYQFDKETGGNWVKKIIIPENSYTTRKITYFKEEPSVVENKQN